MLPPYPWAPQFPKPLSPQSPKSPALKSPKPLYLQPAKPLPQPFVVSYSPSLQCFHFHHFNASTLTLLLPPLYLHYHKIENFIVPILDFGYAY